MHNIRRRILALALALFAAALIAAKYTNQIPPSILATTGSTLVVITGAVLALIALLMTLTTFDRGRSSAVLRLDWFVPALRRMQNNQLASHSLLGRSLRKILPASIQSDRTTKRRGRLRKWLRQLGLSWLASPVRRIVQTTFLVLFLILFFYVCWPYNARPISTVPASKGWTFERLDQATGDFLLRSNRQASDTNPSFEIAAGSVIFLFDEVVSSGLNAGSSNRLGAFQVASVSNHIVRLHPAGETTPRMIDAFFAGAGTFALYSQDPTAWPSHYADNLESKEWLPAEFFLIIDPLVGLSTAIASRSWVWSLVSAAAILIVCVLIPRGFCGYLCPLGTTIDLFDWAIAGRTKRFRVPNQGWWVHTKYYLLAGTLIAALFGVLISGFFSAIPVLTRGMLFIFEPLQSGLARGWHLVPAINAGHLVSITLFAAVLCLGFLRPRFWCKYVCPSGALFSVSNLFRITERKVESSCINCNKCVEICPFDAIKPDFTTRTTDCTMCQSCGGVCPTHAIKFVERWNVVELKIADDPPTHETPLGRRGFLSLAVGSTAAAVGGISLATATKSFGGNLSDPNAYRPVRPPGSVPEEEFLEMCIRCGECFKACPNNVLQPEGFQQGLEGLWTPLVNANWAGCESSCNACGQVCPTGAIRALPLEEKKVARMGLAIVNESTCLPFAGRDNCDLCVQECNAAGYHAIEYTQVGTEVDESGQPIDGTGYLAPIVLKDHCVGCGLCQTRCYAINVKEKHLLSESAIVIEAGEGKEDRLMSGSYMALREQERALRAAGSDDNRGNYFIPESVAPGIDRSPTAPFIAPADDPFGVGNEATQGTPSSTSPADDNPFGL